ncbi:MAG: protein kinase domain-containing protein, partial [Bryobacteraceae bacterium]
MALVPGTRLGRYEIAEALGAGGMGEVYRARDERLDRYVAVKVLPPHLARDPQALARFEREAKAVAALSHPNILALYDIGTEGDVSYAVTELLEGETLRSRLAREQLPARRAAHIAVAVAEGLAAAHSKGITHRDLKPENIFLTTAGQVKILDFGLARVEAAPEAETALTAGGAIMGTAGYMSPEQVRGQNVDARTDIFSLGCVLYEMLSRRRAFTGLASVLETAPSPIDGSALERVAFRCLEKNPSERFQTAADLAFALREPAPVATSSRSWKIPAAAALVVLVVLLAWWLMPRRRLIDSLAVLPFVNASGDPAAEYLGDGITENLINTLAQLPKLRVVPRSSAFRYKSAQNDLRKVAEALGVKAVLTGRVHQRGDTLNVQAELVDVAADAQLWGRQYSRPGADILAVQEEIAREVSDKLGLRPTNEEQQKLARRSTQNTEAYQSYLKGSYHLERRTGSSMRRAAEYFQQAVSQDPTYAKAWASLAFSYSTYAYYDIEAPRVALPKAKTAVEKALALDPALSESHSALASIKLWGEWDWSGAERAARRAIELDPGNGSSYIVFSASLLVQRRLDEYLAGLRRAVEVEPLSLMSNALLARAYSHSGDYDAAIEQSRK